MYSDYPNKLYRSRSGIIFGVCQGFADWRELPVGMVRLVFLLTLIFTGFFPVILIYFGLAIFLPLEPPAYKRPRDRRREDDDPDFGRDRERDWDQRFYK